MTQIFIGIGSNLGDRKENIARALEFLEKEFGALKVSSVLETEPWGNTEGGLFLNCAASAETGLPARAVLEKLLEIERRFGRNKKTLGTKEKDFFEARKIDLDLLFYGNAIIDENDLVVPHPRIAERKFVLVALDEIAPNFIHPILKKSMHELLSETTDAKSAKKVV